MDYAAFLSHMKHEAGMEARYMRDKMQKMLRKPVFLDSSNLTDLRRLIKHGLCRCDTVVLLATKGVLLRPWCLLELWVASQKNIPIVVFEIGERGFTWAEARSILTDLPAAMEESNVSYLMEQVGLVMAEQAADGTSSASLQMPSIAQVGVQIFDALNVRERRGAVFHPWGTDNELLADMSDLIDLMHQAVGRAAPRTAQAHFHRQLRARNSLQSITLNIDRAGSRRRRISSRELGLSSPRNVLRSLSILWQRMRKSKSSDELRLSGKRWFCTSRGFAVAGGDQDARFAITICCCRFEAETIAAAKLLQSRLMVRMHQPRSMQGLVLTLMIGGKATTSPSLT